ncbi:hypothetical protein [Streptomyces sp. SAI-090]|jgi:hypothetical protein|nr:hypothetical protein [Streptomyces sp. SAI-090]MDH6522189.1 hypothetical protein [Streptomyces sp. SAI-090]
MSRHATAYVHRLGITVDLKALTASLCATTGAVRTLLAWLPFHRTYA